MVADLLDTNIAIHVIQRRPPAALKVSDEHNGRMAISSITLAELLPGVEKGSDPARNRAAVDAFSARLAFCLMERTRQRITAAFVRCAKNRVCPSA